MDPRSHCWLLGKPREPEVRDKEDFLGMVFYRKCRTLLLRQVQFSRSVMSDSATPWTAGLQASLSITSTWNLLRLMSIELVMPSNHPILCRPLLLLPSIFPSFRVFSSESALHIRWPKYWSFSFNSVLPVNTQD